MRETLEGLISHFTSHISVFRTLWPVLSVLHHTVVYLVPFYAPYTGFLLNTGSHTKLQH